MRKNIFLTGAPSSGKTTVIKKVIALLEVPAVGFYTVEERINGRRTGFLMKSLDGGEGYLAHENLNSRCKVRRYGVSLENIASIAVPSILPVPGAVIILDEIGRMECFSAGFRDAALRALDSDCVVVGTITLGGDRFIGEIKGRTDVELTGVTPENRDTLPMDIVHKIRTLLTAQGTP